VFRLISIAVVIVGVTLTAQNPRPLFGPGSTVKVGLGPGIVILANIDGDAHLDLVTRQRQNRTVAVLLGDGKGAFKPAAGSPISFASTPGGIALGDLNNDRIVDLAITISERDALDVLLGDGRGGFTRVAEAPFIVSPSTAVHDRSIWLEDLNEDGNLDVVSATDGREKLRLPAMLFGDGRGRFRPGPTIPIDAGANQYGLGFADVDGDKHLDVVTATRTSGEEGVPGRLVVQRGDGRGGFGEPVAAPLSVPPSARLATLADLNGDQRVDLVLTHPPTGLVSVLMNGGAGRFASAPGSPFTLNSESYDVAAADLNLDKKMDLVVATVDSQSPPYVGAVAVLLSSYRGLVPAAAPPVRVGPGAYRLAVGDINEDGKPDVVSSSYESDAVTVLLGT